MEPFLPRVGGPRGQPGPTPQAAGRGAGTANPCLMSLRSPLTRRAALGGLAVSGLIAGHCLAYRFFGEAGPHAHHHGSHSHLPYVLALVAGLLVATLGSVIDHRLGERKPGIATTASLLLAAQLGGFVGLSLLDGAMGTPGTEVGSRAFWVGLVIQVIVAGLGALVLAALRKTIEAIDRALRAELPQPATDVDSSYVSLTVAIPALAMATGGPTFRGPPQSP